MTIATCMMCCELKGLHLMKQAELQATDD